MMLARNAAADLDPAGWLVSEKFDGVRAHWDGRQLRLRGGGAVAAPTAFIDRLPAGMALDGELWLGRGRFDDLSGRVRRERPDAADWAGVRYLVFDLPGRPDPFSERWARLQTLLPLARPEALTDPAGPVVLSVPQQRLADRRALRQQLDAVLAVGGEGLMLHRADALWRPGRSDALLKLKPVADAEASVIGHEPGQGRHAGRLGALRVRDDQGREFAIGSGLTDAQRDHPPPVGSVVTYRWRGATASGLPRFATLWRVRPPGL